MINKNRWQILILATLLAINCSLFADQPNAPEQKKETKQAVRVEFALKDSAPSWYSDWQSLPVIRYEIKPTHLAEFSLSNYPSMSQAEIFRSRGRSSSQKRYYRTVKDSNWAFIRMPEINIMGEGWIGDLLEADSTATLSDRQRGLIKRGLAIVLTSQSPLRVKVLGYSEADVRSTTEAMLEVLDGYAVEAEKEISKSIESLNKGMSKKEDEKKKLSDQRKDILAKIDKLRKKVHYVSVDEAKERIQQLNAIIENKEIYLHGKEIRVDYIRTKTLNIKEELKANAGDSEKDYKLLLELESMLVKEMIDLVTLEGESNLAKQIRNLADEYVLMHEQVDELRQQISNAKNGSESLSKKLKRYDQFISTEQAKWFKPQLEPAIVTIYSVGVTETQ